jgi:hypothetical protein
MKNAGKSWVLGAILGLLFNVFGLLAVYFIKNRGTSKPKIGKSERFAIEQFKKLASYTNDSISDFKSSLESSKTESPNRILLTINGVELREVRFGTVVATTSGTIQGKSRSGTIGLSGKHIGIAATSSSFRGKMHSTTITPPAPETLQKIDDGKILVRPDVIAFVGSKYSKSIEYKDILDWVSNSTPNPFANQLTIAVKGLDKAVIFVLSLPSEGEFLDGLLSEVVSSKNQHLNTTLTKAFQAHVSEYVNSREQEVKAIESLVENKTGITEKWKNFALNGEDVESV